MSSATKYIYVDEAGATHLPKCSDEADYYVITGLLVEGHKQQELSLKARNIVNVFARGGELKSSQIGSDQKRRRKVLEAISTSFPSYSFVINKSQIWKDSGLRWKTSSYKNYHSMFYNRIKVGASDLSIFVDSYGTVEFMESFEPYIQQKNNFYEKLEFLLSKEMPLLQIADVIAGSIRRVLLGEDPESFLEMIGYPSIPIEIWPPNSNFQKSEYKDTAEYDHFVVNFALEKARCFVEKNFNNAHEEKRIQAEVLRYLLQRFYESPSDYIYRDEINRYIQQIGYCLSIPSLTSSVLAPLRDEGVILVSTDKGVKIPYTSMDMGAWVNRVNTQVTPYLKRLQRARNDILIHSNNKYDIVDKENFPDLMKYISGLQSKH